MKNVSKSIRGGLIVPIPDKSPSVERLQLAPSLLPPPQRVLPSVQPEEANLAEKAQSQSLLSVPLSHADSLSPSPSPSLSLWFQLHLSVSLCACVTVSGLCLPLSIAYVLVFISISLSLSHVYTHSHTHTNTPSTPSHLRGAGHSPENSVPAQRRPPESAGPMAPGACLHTRTPHAVLTPALALPLCPAAPSQAL